MNFTGGMQQRRKVSKSGAAAEVEALKAGLPLSFLSWAYVFQGVYIWAYGMPGVSIFGAFLRQVFPFSA